MEELTNLTNPDELSQKLIASQDPDDIKNYINLINLNIKKKQAIRSTKFSEMQDKIVEQMQERIFKRPGEFSNRELLEYVTSIQSILDKSDAKPEDIPMVAIQNNINVNQNSEFDEESRARMKEALKAVLNQPININNNQIENSIIDNKEILPEDEQ